jgi:uncharacterized protein (TIGR03083 family)
MDRASHLALLAADAELLVAEAAAGLDRPVPTCPGWTCERLVGHVGRVYRWTAGWIVTGASTQVERPPAGAAAAGWARDGLAELLAAFDRAHADPDARVATWAGDQPVAFWPRRMALETAVHRVDAQLAAGATTPVDTALAVEGVDELLTVLLPWRGTAGLGGDGETIHLHATDPDIDEVGGGEWLVTLGPDALAVERSHAKGDVAVRGPASDLFLLLWNRVGTDGLQVFGDARLLDRWREAVHM